MEKDNKSKAHKKGRLHHLTLHDVYILSIVLIALFIEGFIIFDIKTEWFTISENSLYYVYSTGATIIATLYGLTLTGYIFFSDRLQNTIGDDNSLYDPVELLKRRYNRMAIFVTIVSVITIFMCIVVLLYGENNDIFPEWAHRLILDETLLMFFISLSSIAYFILNVIDPDKIQRISDRRKIQMDKTYDGDTEGDFDEFVAYYEEIESMIVEAVKDASAHTRKNPLKNIKPLVMMSADTLKAMNIINDAIWEQVSIVREYYNYVIHSSDQTVSKQMCDFAHGVRDELAEKFQKIDTDEQDGSSGE